MDFFDFNSMIIGLISISILFLIFKKKIEFRRYIPGLICIIIVFIAEVLEDNLVVEEDMYYLLSEILENAGILLGSILLLLAALFEYYKSKPKKD
ncbi:MAG: hypothetical protein ACFFAO_10145 [Candidatus Hermodarchaeota archaeon]